MWVSQITETYFSVSENGGRTSPQHTEKSDVQKPSSGSLPWWLSPLGKDQLSAPPSSKTCLCNIQRCEDRLKSHRLPNWCIKPECSCVYVNERFFQLFLQWSSRCSSWLVFRAVVLKLYRALESLREPVKTQTAGPYPQSFWFSRTGWDPSFHV